MRAFFLCLLGSALLAQSPYQLAIDQDRLGGAPDFSFLNHTLTAADRIFVRDGHFYRVGADREPFTADDERVRFFGVNLAFGANFPVEADAPRIARRLRRLGVNLVRLHHMDSSPDSAAANANSLLLQAPYPTLNTTSVHRLRAFLDALKQEGIYCNLNLHVGYTFVPGRDGVPAGTIPTQSKPLHMIGPKMIELQRKYTSSVIDALGLRGDPVLAMVEINNESSLLYSWQSGALDTALTGEYLTELQTRWNAWLRANYRSTDGLRDAWSASDPDGPELLGNSWKLEVHSPAQATLQYAGSEQGWSVRVAKGGAPVIVKLLNFSVGSGKTYQATVEMRADLAVGQSRNVYWDVKQDITPWNTESGKTISVTNEWQTFTMNFTAGFDMTGIGRFGLSVENVDAPVYFRNWSLHFAAPKGLADGESLEQGNIALVHAGDFATEARANDYLLFLADRDQSYLDAMLAEVRAATDEMVPVAGTQMGYGGLLNYDSHSNLDYQDHHFYVDHYNFPNVAWDGRDWRFRDTSSVGSGLSAILNVAAARQSDRPYTVSEFNQPWPNTYSAEIDPLLAAVGSFQDWDGILHFAYSHGRNWDDGVPNGFNINGDWTKFPNIGQAAWIFRAGAIATGKEPVEIPLSIDDRLRAGRERRNGNVAAFLTSAFGYDASLALLHPVRLARDGEGAMPALAKLKPPYRADSGEMLYDPATRRMLLQSAFAAGVFGFIGEEKVTAGAIDVQLAPAGRGYVSLLVTPIDGEAIADSSRLLVSNPGYTLRSQPGITPVRPQSLIHYPGTTDWWTLEADVATKPSGDLNGGRQPVWMERVDLDLTLRTTAESIVVYPLGGAGQRLAPLAADRIQPVAGGFLIHLAADTPWYEITRQ